MINSDGFAIIQAQQLERCERLLHMWLSISTLRRMVVRAYTAEKPYRVELWQSTTVVSSADGHSFLDALSNAVQGVM